jgi:hypothetical protein
MFFFSLRSSLREKLVLYHENFLRIVGFHGTGDESLCGEFDRLTVFTEYIPFALDQEVARRARKSVK